MRITSGYLKGRKIFSPPVINLRLTEEKIRKAIFDILADKVMGSSILELFAGSGALGIEALSRGAKEATFVDLDPRCIDTIKRNIPSELKDKSRIILSDSLRAINRLAEQAEKFDLVILDPPYRKGLVVLTLKKIYQYCILLPDAIVVIEHHRDENLKDIFFDHLELVSQKKYGDALVSLLKFGFR